MFIFFSNLKDRNELLFYFGAGNLVAAVIFILLTQFTSTQISNVNAWYKPFKFAASIGIYAWTMGWICAYLPESFIVGIFNWAVIILLGFEIIYIVIQASRGMLSHFNVSSPFYSSLYVLMAMAATGISVYTAYIAILFFKNDFPDLEIHYLWALRLSLIIFVIFSLEGFVMGSRMSHTIGGTDDGKGLPVLNWSRTFGDPRVAHFIGMHALQVLPLLANYLVKDVKAIFLISFLYFLLAAFTLRQALQGKPLFK